MTPTAGSTYEDEKLLGAYLLFHYGSIDEIRAGSEIAASIPEEAFRFPVRTVAETFEAPPQGRSGRRALDVGCAVGRSSFELSRLADEVIGIDFSRSFVAAANRLKAGEAIPYRRFSEGHISEELAARRPETADAGAVRFETGDAMALRPDLGRFDYVHAANLLCRLANPRAFLERLADLVKPGGQLVMATPASWMPDFTPPENQPAGRTLDFLHQYLDAEFDLRRVREFPFAIREHDRKFQLSTSQTSLWARR